MTDFARDYLIFVFFFGLGAIQIAVSLGRLNGLLLFYRPLVSRIAGMAIVLGVIVWFFSSEPRNINDIHGGLDGNAQTMLFAIGSAAAILVTLVVSSLLNIRLRDGANDSSGEGLESLKRNSYAVALAQSLGYWWKRWRR